MSKITPLLALLALAFSSGLRAQPLLENLDRGVVALPAADGSVFISWRLLGKEAPDLGFDVFRQVDDGSGVKLNFAPLAGPTHFNDRPPASAARVRYAVRPSGGRAPDLARPSAPFTLSPDRTRPYVTVPLQIRPGGTTPDGKAYTYVANDAAPADLDGDGAYEIILRWEPTNSHGGNVGDYTGPVLFDAYKLDGTRLWRIDLGPNVTAGAHLVNFIAYDLDGDGRAEFATKTANGTVDGIGKILGDPLADHRPGMDGVTPRFYRIGNVNSGPEFVTIFDGRDGRALASAPYLPRRHPDTDDPTPAQQKAVWGDNYGNRMNRFLVAVAHLDGRLPSIVFCRGYYTRSVLAAWDWRDGKLSSRWIFDSDAGPESNRAYRGQGNHNLSVVDVDNDGRDEIVYGAMTVDDTGLGLYSTGLGHGDAQHVSDLDPDRPGVEVFGIQERFGDAGARMFDATTGRILWKIPSVKAGDDGEGPGRALAADIDPTRPGAECWVAGAGITGLFDPRGKKIAPRGPRSVNFAAWWDGDLLRELVDSNRVMKWDWKTGKLDNLLVAEGAVSNNGTKSTPCLTADLFGDWREEIVWRTADNSALRIYSTTVPTATRLPTLMHDAQYRLGVAWQNAGYNQPPHPSFYLGPDRTPPTRFRPLALPATRPPDAPRVPAASRYPVKS
jgi:rhamnogalacturonan endolyase